MGRRTQLVVAAAAVLAGAAGAWVVARGDGEPAAAPTTTTTETSTTATAAPEVIGTAGALGVGDPYFPGLGNGGYDVKHYTLALTWNADEGTIDGIATIEAEATQDLSSFSLDLAGMSVAGVTVDGVPAKADHADRELVVTPDDAVPAGESFTAVVTYGGTPTPVSDGTDLFDVGWQTDGREAFVVNEPAGAATFFPVNDHPSDKATYTFEITAPADQVVAANGLLAGERDEGDGTRTWTYEAGDPMASYLVQIAIGDYELVDAGAVGGVVLRHAFHRSLAATARRATERTAEMIDVLDDVFGPYPFEAYGVLAVDEDLGFALETQTLTIIGSDVAGSGRRAEEILLHELAHQWVGDAVSPATWKDVWLNEGFATYSEWLWSERTGGATAAARARALRGTRADLDTPPGDPGSRELFAVTVYWRGGMTLQALREQVGDDAFFRILREWVDGHLDSVAATPEFIALAEQVSGQQLDDLFQRWLYEPGLPSLD